MRRVPSILQLGRNSSIQVVVCDESDTLCCLLLMFSPGRLISAISCGSMIFNFNFLILIHSGRILDDSSVLTDHGIDEKKFIVIMVTKPKTTEAAPAPAAPVTEVAPAPAPVAPSTPAVTQPTVAATPITAPPTSVPAAPERPPRLGYCYIILIFLHTTELSHNFLIV